MFRDYQPTLKAVPEASAAAADDEIQKNRDQALNDLLRAPSDTVNQPSGQAAASDDQTRSKGKQPVYNSVYLPNATDSHLYQAYNEFGRPFTVYEGTAYASSSALPIDIGADGSRPTTPATSVSSPGIPFTPGGDGRHSNFYSQMEHGGTFTPGFPPARPANPSPPASSDSASFLEDVYKNPPLPSPQPTKVPIPARKPVPKPATAGPSKTKANVDKSLPPSPALNSARRFTPMAPRFPRRTDSLNNPVASAAGPSSSLHPNTALPPRQKMNDNGFPMHDARLSADFSVPSEYLRRGPMNEMEAKDRETALKREASKKAADAKAKEKADKQKKKQLEKQEKGVRKLCNLQ